MSTTSYVVKSGDQISPFTYQPINYPPGTTIYGDPSIPIDYGTSPGPNVASMSANINTTIPSVVTPNTVDSTQNNTSTSGTPSTNAPLGSMGEAPQTAYPGQPTGMPSTASENFFEQQIGSQVSAAESSGIISPNFLNTLMQDPSMVAFYTNALTYGQYTPQDVLNDMKRREMVSEGNTQASNLSIIDPNMTRTQYMSANPAVQANTQAIIPTFNIAPYLDSSIVQNYGGNTPSDFLTTPVNTSSQNSAFETGKTNIMGAYSDIVNQQLNAQTEEQKAIADSNYKNLQDQVRIQFGIQLSNNASMAWNQLSNLSNIYGQNNLEGSGIQNQTVDQYLTSVRKADSYMRQAKALQSNSADASYYIQNGSPDQINALNQQDQAAGLPRDQWRTVQWGLTPSQEVKNALDPNTLGSMFPNEPMSRIQTLVSNTIDPNGNYYSTLYGKKIQAQNANAGNSQNMSEYQNSMTGENASRALDNPINTTPPSKNNINPDVYTPASNASKTTSNTNEFNTITGQKLTPGQSYMNSEGKTIKEGTPFDSGTAGNISDAIGNIKENLNTPSSNVTSSSRNTNNSSIPTSYPSNNIPASRPSNNIPTSRPSNNIPASRAPYTVQAGDTLSSIAGKNGTNVDDLSKINNISDPNMIKTGQTLNFQ